MTAKQKVTIIGAGNGGHALSFHLAHLGHQVMLFEHPKFANALKGIKNTGGIEAVKTLKNSHGEAKGCLSGFAKLNSVTTDIKKAMNFADFIFITVPSYAQEPLFDLLIPHLQNEHIITLMPGNFGSLILRNKLKKRKTKAIFAETNSLIHACRRIESGRVLIAGVKDKLAIGMLPAFNTKKIAKKLEAILPLKLIPYQNVLETAFTNMNMVVHPGTTILNMGWCETKKGQFHFYSEGISESVAKVLEKVESERHDIAEKLNFKINPGFLKVLQDFYHQKRKNIYDFAQKSAVHSSIDAPQSASFRYITEDVPYLLVPIYEFGQLTKTPYNAIHSLITLASIMNETDYFKTGRTLKKMGLSGLSIRKILKNVSQPG